MMTFQLTNNRKYLDYQEENVGGYIFEGSGICGLWKLGISLKPSLLRAQMASDSRYGKNIGRNHINALYKAGGGCYGFL